MITSLIDSDLMTKYPADQLTAKLVSFGQIVDGQKAKPAGTVADIDKYLELSRDRTTDGPRRDDRRRIFVDALNEL